MNPPIPASESRTDSRCHVLRFMGGIFSHTAWGVPPSSTIGRPAGGRFPPEKFRARGSRLRGNSPHGFRPNSSRRGTRTARQRQRQHEHPRRNERDNPPHPHIPSPPPHHPPP